MNDYISQIKLDLNCQPSLIVLNAGQYDIGRKYLISITADGVAFNLDSCTAVCKGVRSDKSCFAVQCSIEDNKVIFVTDDSVLLRDGKTVAKIVLNDGSKTYSTQLFVLLVSDAFDGDVTSVDDYSVLNNLIQQVYEIVNFTFADGKSAYQIYHDNGGTLTESQWLASLFEATKEILTNKVTSVSSASTDEQYPSAKCLYYNISQLAAADTILYTYVRNSLTPQINAKFNDLDETDSKKENVSNKTNAITSGIPSSTLYPTEAAVVGYTNSKFVDMDFVVSEIPNNHTDLDDGDILTAKAILTYVDSKGSTPTYAASVDEMTDTTKMYIGSDGHLWAYRQGGANYTNQIPISTDKTGAIYNDTGYKTGSYLSVEGADGSGVDSNAICTGFIPYSQDNGAYPIIRIKGCTVDTSVSHTRVYLYATADSYTSPVLGLNGSNILNYFTLTTTDNGITTLTPKDTLNQSADINYLRVSVVDSAATADDIILTVGESIGAGTGYSWQDTGVTYASGNYDTQIANLVSANTQAQAGIDDLDERVTEIESGIKQIPTYWTTAIDTAVATAKAKQNLGGINAVSFVWLSDMHIHNDDTDSIPYEANIGAVASDVMDKLNINYIVHSGDTTSQAATIGGVVTTLSSVYEDVAKRDSILAPISKQRLISALGNHDGMYGYVDSTSWVYAMSWAETYNLLFRSQALDANRRFAAQGTYFYVDDPPQKFRYVVLNSQWAQYTVSDNGTPSFNRFNSSYYGQEQITWLATDALNMPAGYTAAIIVHCAPNGNDDRYGKDYQLVAGVIKAYYDKSTYTGSYNSGTETWQNSAITVDYTSAVGNVCAVFAGHQHLDRIQSDNPLTGCPIINITAAKNYDYSTNPPTRTQGTATETAMDIVTVDTSARNIYLTRLGVGSDRQVSY